MTKKQTIKFDPNSGIFLEEGDVVSLKNLTAAFLKENNPTKLDGLNLLWALQFSKVVGGRFFTVASRCADGDFRLHLDGFTEEDGGLHLVNNTRSPWLNPAWVDEIYAQVQGSWTIYDLFTVHDVACSAWKQELKNYLISTANWTSGILSLPRPFVKKMLSAANSKQESVIRKVTEFEEECTVRLQRQMQSDKISVYLEQSPETYAVGDTVHLNRQTRTQVTQSQNNPNGLSNEAWLKNCVVDLHYPGAVFKIIHVFPDGDYRLQALDPDLAEALYKEFGIEDMIVAHNWIKPATTGNCHWSFITIPYRILIEWNAVEPVLAEALAGIKTKSLSETGLVLTAAEFDTLYAAVKNTPQEIISALNSNGN